MARNQERVDKRIKECTERIEDNLKTALQHYKLYEISKAIEYYSRVIIDLAIIKSIQEEK